MPPKPMVINWEEFDKLCALQCTLDELCSWFDCSEDTIERHVKKHSGMRYADYFKLKRGKGRISLRRRQFEAAMSGDKTMLIWLGKQYLGQTDKQDVEFSSPSEIKVNITKYVPPGT